MYIAHHVIRLSRVQHATWHAADVQTWAPYRVRLRDMARREASLRFAHVEVQDADGEPIAGYLPPRDFEPSTLV